MVSLSLSALSRLSRHLGIMLVTRRSLRTVPWNTLVSKFDSASFGRRRSQFGALVRILGVLCGVEVEVKWSGVRGVLRSVCRD